MQLLLHAVVLLYLTIGVRRLYFRAVDMHFQFLYERDEMHVPLHVGFRLALHVFRSR